MALARSRCPEIGLPRAVPRAVHQRRPVDLAHRGRQIVVVGRVAVQVGVAGPIEEGRADRHHGHARPVAAVRVPAPVLARHGAEPGRELHGDDLLAGGRAGRQGDVVPVLVPRVERPPDIHCIDPEAVEDELLRLSKLLHHVVDPGVALANPEVLFQVVVRDGRDPRARRRAQVHRHAVGFAMVDGGKHTLAGGQFVGHNSSFVLRIAYCVWVVRQPLMGTIARYARNGIRNHGIRQNNPVTVTSFGVGRRG